MRPRLRPPAAPLSWEEVRGRLERYRVLCLAEVVASEYAVALPSLLGRTRAPRVWEARRRLWCAIRDAREELSIADIAWLVDRSPSTVTEGIRRQEAKDRSAA